MSRGHKPHAPKIEHIELSEKNIKLRWFLVVALIAIAVISILWGVFGSRQKSGWYTVESHSAGLHCGHEFLFNYEYGAEKRSAAEEGKELQKFYTELTENAWKLFYSEAGETQLGNLYRVNSHPNQEVAVEPELYAALQLLETENSRLHYLGPVYAAYDQVFLSNDELIAAQCDPGQDAETAQYVLQLAQYAADPNAIRLELRQNNKVYLHISPEYKAFLDEYMVETYVDFGWLRSAFVIDYMAGKLEENGFTNGFLTSVDGFTRNLDRRGRSYSMNLFNLRDGKTELVATMDYSQPVSMVYLRTYDSSKVFTFRSGRVVTYMADLADGQCKAATPNLVSYSGNAGCAQVALRVAPSFIADSFDPDNVKILGEEDIYSIWFEDKMLHHNQAELQISLKNDTYILSPAN